LLRNGADPNVADTYNRTSAFMSAATYGPDYDRSPALLNLLLAYGGDPNAVEQGTKPDEPQYKPRNTPLLYAAGCCLEKTKRLVEAGANVNFKNENQRTALLAALHGGKEGPQVVHYLLLECKADFKNSFVVTYDTHDTICFAQLLRQWVYPLNSPEHKTKMEIVHYLQVHGQNYWETPVPEEIKRHYAAEYVARY